MLRSSIILATGFFSCLLIGAAVAPSYAASSDSDGVTIVQAAPAAQAPAAPAQAATAPMEQVQLSDGDVVTAPAGAAITTAMDPKTGDFTTVIMGAGQ